MPSKSEIPFCDKCHDRRAIYRMDLVTGCEHWCQVCFETCFPSLAKLVAAQRRAGAAR